VACSAKEVGVVAFGGGKADIIETILTDPSAGYPAQRVQPEGKLAWLLDAGSAGKVSSKPWK
jgi:6-phosphogluconolactonase/glucosamine-6-phosphate isomerase/deaminase